MNKYTERMNNTLEKLSDSREKFLGNLVDKLENYIDINSELESEYKSLSNTDEDYREILNFFSDENQRYQQEIMMTENRINMIKYSKDVPFITMHYFMKNLRIHQDRINQSSD